MSLLSTPPDEPVAAHRGRWPQGRTPRTFEPDLPDATRRALSSGKFLAATALLYVSIILLAVLTLNPYFAQTWDVATFIQAAHRFLDGGNPFDLYAVTRAAQTWPYAYPPLHAMVVALALKAGTVLTILPDYVWARVPALLADLCVGVALYYVIEWRAQDSRLARFSVLLWLFNPVTFYNTAVQGHFESEWLLFVIVAYMLHQGTARDTDRDTGNRSFGVIFGTAAALAVAVLFKQVAVLFALPLWASLLRPGLSSPEPLFSLRRWSMPVRSLALSVAVFSAIIGIVSLPYLVYSNDFLYMNLTYVENVPVQTASWLIALLAMTRSAADALTSDFFLFRYQTVVTILAAGVIALWGARRNWSLYLTAALIALLFFLTSKKVMGYYYLLLLPFLLAEFVPRRRWDVVLLAMALTGWMTLSPYYAAWVDHSHWWVYAVIGIANSALFLLLAWAMLQPAPVWRTSARAALVVTLGLFAGAALAALFQPFIQSTGSPIRAPILAPQAGASALLALVLLLAGVVAVTAGIAWGTREQKEGVGIGAWALVLLFAPLSFAVYTLTKESTALVEIALKQLGG